MGIFTPKPATEPPTKEEQLVSQALTRYDRARDAWLKNFDEAKSDIEFTFNVGEGQWPQDIINKRDGEERPLLTMNKLNKFTKRLTGEQEQNPQRIKTRPVDSEADPQIAEIYDEIIRNIEYNSKADSAYSWGFKCAIAGGFGYWRIVTDFEHDRSFNQEAIIKRIANQFSVYYDPNANDEHFADAEYCFIVERIAREDFKVLYPDNDPINFDDRQNRKGYFSRWVSDNDLMIAEYYYFDVKEITIGLIKDPSDPNNLVSVELTVETRETLKESNIEILKERKSKVKQLMWLKMNAKEILEGPLEQAGEFIPVIFCPGSEVNLQDDRIFQSLVRDAKDAQRNYNYFMTSFAELVATIPKAPYLITDEQIKGYEADWADASKKVLPYLKYNHEDGQSMPSRVPMAGVSDGMIAMMQFAEFNLKDILGMFETTLAQKSNERSGKAITKKEIISSTITFGFINNFRKSIIHTGRVLTKMIPKIYDTARVIRIMGEEGKTKILKINQSGGGGFRKLFNDVTVGKYDVITDTAFMNSSRRSEILVNMMEILQYAPDIIKFKIAPKIIALSDFPGSKELADDILNDLKDFQQQQLATKQ
jgi:hypothetical protein